MIGTPVSAVPQRRVVRRVLAVGAICAAVVVGAGPPAHAHGPTPDATNYRSRVTGLVDQEDDSAYDSADISWRVLGGDGLLEVRNTGAQRVVVTGYDGEPYLRVGPDGVFENRRSPATYLNADRFGVSAVPDRVDPAASPEWRRLTDDVTWRWHDHRIHWMAPAPPPDVQQRPDARHRVLEWVVPFRVDAQQLQVEGELDYLPPPAVWPWLAVPAAALSAVVGAFIIGGRPRRAVRVLVVAVVAAAAAGLVVAIGDALVTPTSVGNNAAAVVQTGGVCALGGALAWTAWRAPANRNGAQPAAILVVAALIVGLAGGVSRLGQLTSALVVNAMPAAVVRGIVATCLTLTVPAVLLALSRPTDPTTVRTPADARERT